MDTMPLAGQDDHEVHVVTGAYSFTGRHIARRLLNMGKTVRTLTGHPERASAVDPVRAYPYNFTHVEDLVQSLRGASTFYNTYWIRFERGPSTFAQAVENTRTLVRAAKEAGVRRFVHVSIANPSLDSPLGYYRGKAQAESIVEASGMSYAIIRPTVLFGDEGLLINNIAWFLRHLPVFAYFGGGRSLLQPVYAMDEVDLIVRAGQDTQDVIVDAAGPDTFTFEEMLRLIRKKVRGRALLVPGTTGMAMVTSKVLGKMLDDVVLTADEVAGLQGNLLVSHAKPTCPTHLGDWLEQNAGRVGTHYQSELQRHYR